jgi:galactose mutarotase-like enzyme
MFAITKQPQAESIYVLNDRDSNSSLTVYPDRGGIATSWRVGDRELMYLDADRFTDPNLSVRGGFPILFPICGNLPDNTYTVADRHYTLKQHGFARDLPWQVTHQATVEDARLTITLDSNAATREVYPFDFSVSFTYRLRGNELAIEQAYTNKSDRSMPMSTGLHPYFYTPDKNALSFDIAAPNYYERVSDKTYPFTGKFDLSVAEIDAAFTDVASNVVTVTDAAQHLTLTMTSSQQYRTIVFWTQAGKDFYCIEPWSAPRNSINTGVDLLNVAPGETLSTSIAFVAKFG